MVVPEGFKHTWSPGQLCTFGLVSVVLMGLTSPQTVGDQTGTDPPSSPITVNNTTNVTEPSIIIDWEERIIVCYFPRFNNPVQIIAGVLVFVLVLVLIIDCYRKNCAKQAQRPDQENAIERVPLDSPTPRDHTPEDCPTGKLTKDCDGVSVEVCGVAARPRVNHG